MRAPNCERACCQALAVLASEFPQRDDPVICRGRFAWWRRLFDITMSALGLLVCAPLFAAVAVAIVVDDRGPVFFRQERIGRYGQPFTIWKFRSMHAGASHEPHRQSVAAWFAERTHTTGTFKSAHDSRITRVGGFLRRTSLDELPQLINVLFGDMSLVGPRPVVPYEREMYEEWYYVRECMRPGMTGLWQVSGRAELSAREMMRLDVQYVQSNSFRSDLGILFQTVPMVLSRRRHSGV